MRIDEITVFVRVLEAGSFAAAARSLGMPTTTVSAKVAALEARLGTTLIQRTTRQLRATPAGELYLDRCRTALQEIETAEAELASDNDEPTGTLRITGPTALGRTLLPELIAGYRQEFPAVKVEVLVMDRIADLVAESIDLAIRVGPLKDSSLIVRKLLDGDGGFYASQAYLDRHGTPQTLDDLANHQIVGFARGGKMLYRGEIVEVTLDAPITTNDFHVSRAFMDLDLGIGYLPSPLEKAWRGQQALVRVLPEYSTPPRSLYFVYPRQRFVPARVRSFITFATARAELLISSR
ncbi:LysR substrate-binding domain-containing protein [Mesorhizobium sp. IMUNJ 23232]|uniref:LysR family transcriptional regulator n=1 Tax=Mesorhizobium sp. IMUNJ 23232 TaxID=3376064 RepID=UPI00379B8A77